MIGAVGYLAKLFDVFERLGLSVDIVAASEATVSVTIDHLPSSSEQELVRELGRLGEVRMVSSRSLVAVVSPRLRDLAWVSRILELLKTQDMAVDIISHGNSKLNLALILDQTKATAAAQMIHDFLLHSSI
jgi:aspartate kinase